MTSIAQDMDGVDPDPPTSKIYEVANIIETDIITSQSSGSSSGDDGGDDVGDESEVDDTGKVIENILELQKALVELTQKNQNILEENHEIEEEVQVLQKYIDNMMRNSYSIVRS